VPNSQNRKFTFGFLNDAQDATDIATNEGTIALSLDADKLALGTLQKSTYLAAGFPVPSANDTAVVNGRNFRLNSGVLEFEEIKDGGSWKEVNAYDEIGTPNPNTSQPPKADVPVVTAVDNANIDVAPGDIITADTTTDELEARVKPGTTISLTLPTRTYSIKITVPGAPLVYHWEMRYITDDPSSSYRATGGPIINNTDFFDVADNIQIRFPTIGALPTEWPASVNQFGAYTVTQPRLPDGTYTYLLVAIKNSGLTPNIELQGLPSDAFGFEIKNFDEAGVRDSSLQPSIAYPSSTFAYTYVHEVWLFRKGQDEDSFIRINVFESSPTTAFLDDTLASEIINLNILASEKDEGFPKLNEAVGNTAETFSRLFEKDNRLWLQPTTRPDLLLYSRLGDWWGWQRDNAFAFAGDTAASEVVDITFTRDPTVVGGEFTMVIFTTEGIFHITGNGTENSPYKLFTAVRNIQVAQNSVVDMNGIIMFTTFSDDGLYDTGPYGQKIYEYDLQKVIEVSGRVKNSDFIASTADIQFAVMRGGDKYLVKKDGVNKSLVYHRDVQGWVEVNKTDEDAGNWNWTSKNFTPQFFDRFKIANARKFKIDFVGTINLVFGVYGPDSTVAPQAFTYALTSNGAGANRTELIRRLPALKGRKWAMEINTSASAQVFDFYLVI